MDPLSRIFAQTLDNVEYLHQHGSITAEAYGVIVQNLMQVEQAPPPPVQQPIPSGSYDTLPPPVQSEPERYVVDSPASTIPPTERGAKNKAVYEYLNEKRVGDVVNQLLKIHPFMSRSDRKALVHAVRKPLAKGVAAATSPDNQAAMRKSTSKSLAAAGRSTSSAFKGLKPKGKESGSASEELGVNEDAFDGADIVTDEDGESRFIKAMSSSLEIAPGLVLDVDTIVRVILDPEVLAAVD